MIESADLAAHDLARSRLWKIIDQLRLRKIAPVSTRGFSSESIEARRGFLVKLKGAKYEWLNDLTSQEVQELCGYLVGYFGIEER